MSQRGFSLIEVLVAVVVLSIGLIGLASLQTNALRFSQDGYLQAQAVAIGQDALERMRRNEVGVEGGDYDEVINAGYSTTAPTSCLDGACNAELLANWDKWELAAHFRNPVDNDDAFVPTLPDGSSMTIARDNDDVVSVVIAWPSLPESAAGDGTRRVTLQAVF